MNKLGWQVTLIWAVVILAVLIGIIESAAPMVPAPQGCTTDLDCMMQEGSFASEPWHPFPSEQEV